MSHPCRREPADPAEGTISVREAAALLGVTPSTVVKYCRAIPAFAQRRPNGGVWLIDPGVMWIVGAIRMATGGTLPLGALVAETERRTVLLRWMLTMARHPEAVAQIKAIAARMAKASARPKPKCPEVADAGVRPAGQGAP